MAAVGKRAPAERTHLGRRLLAGVLLAAGDDDVGSRLRERAHDLATETPGAAGDERNPPGEIEPVVRRT